MRVIKRTAVTTATKTTNLVICLLIAVVIISIFLLLLGKNPFTAYLAMVNAIFSGRNRGLSLLKYIVPLVMVSLGISVAFKMRFWNIGGEGQLIMGAIFASYWALFHDYLPSGVLLSTMGISGILGGGLYALLAAFIKVKFRVNETIVTLMLNYIALQFITYLQYVAWKKGSFPVIATFAPQAILPNFNGISAAVIIALLVSVFTYLIMNRTRLGFEISIAGASEATANYVGINLTALTLVMALISGGIIGLAGFIQVAGNLKTLSIGVTLGVGFTGVVIAWISKLNVIKIIIISCLFACLVQGAGALDTLYGIPASSVDVIQAIVLFAVLAMDFLNEYRLSFKEEL